MAPALPRLRDWRIQLAAAALFSAVSLRWIRSSLDLSASYSGTVDWVATDTIAYFGWGALAGLGLAMVPLCILAAIVSRNARPIGPPDPLFRWRHRPLIMFLLGLSVGVVLSSLAVIAALVASGTQVSWPVIWSVGFGAAVMGWVPLLAAGYLSYAHHWAPASTAQA